MKNKLLVMPAPFKTKTFSTNALMYCMLVALLPTAISGVIVFGIRALFLILISVLTAYLFDLICNYLKTKKINYLDVSGAVTGFIGSLILPVSVPLYLPVIANFIAIVVFKSFFGGIGKNIFNPAGVARVILGFMFTGLTLDLFTGTALGGAVNSPLYYYELGDFSTITLRSLFFGTAPSAIGTASIFCILVCGIFLMVYGVTDYVVPLTSFVTFSLAIWIFEGSVAIIPYLFTGSFLFVSLFMLPDPTSSPNTVWGKFCYGLIFGALSATFRLTFVLGETSVFVALILVNLIASLLDKIFTPRPLGIRKEF